MIVEERHINIDEIKPVLSDSKGKFVSCILRCMKCAITPFLQAYKSITTISLNEDELTEIFYSSIFSIECKRLPAPDKRREQEYVIGNKNNGGIERYKKEIHGKGLSECGMLGFVEENTFIFWKKCINTWISDLSTRVPDIWKTGEYLEEIENNEDFVLLKSMAHRTSEKDICLHHLWINIQ